MKDRSSCFIGIKRPERLQTAALTVRMKAKLNVHLLLKAGIFFNILLPCRSFILHHLHHHYRLPHPA